MVWKWHFKAEQSDIEANNLIKFLGLNKPELCTDRESHIAYIRSLREICGNDSTLFLEQLRSFPQNLSFITALEQEFNFTLQHFL